MTVSELGQRMTAREFFEWAGFAAVHPLPADLIDHHGAMLAAILANVHRGEGAPALSVRDFALIRDPRNAAAPAKPKMTEAQRMRAGIGR